MTASSKCIPDASLAKYFRDTEQYYGALYAKPTTAPAVIEAPSVASALCTGDRSQLREPSTSS